MENLNVPMGSTKKVGEFVRGGRVPEDYASSPTLYSKRFGEKEKKKDSVQHTLDRKGKEKERVRLRVKTRICARDLVPDELLYFDVVLGHKVDRVFLLLDASRSRPTLDRVTVGAFKYKCSRLTHEVAGLESEDLLKFCRGKRATVVMDSEGMGKTMEMASYTRQSDVNLLYVSAVCFRCYVTTQSPRISDGAVQHY